MNKGLFVVLYGPEGVGKSRQIKMLEEKLLEKDILARSIRYPIYDCNPTGPKLDEILHRTKKKFPEEEMQQMFAQNRRDFEPTLKSWLDSGVVVIAENYNGTGLAWGNVRGVNLETLEKMNAGQKQPDISIYVDGPKRGDSYPPDHLYGDEDEWYRLRKAYLQLADKYGWVRVGADAPVLTVASRVWAVVRPVVAVL